MNAALQPAPVGTFEVQSRLHPEPAGNVQEPAGSKDSSTATPGMQGLISAGESHRPSRSRRMRATRRRGDGAAGGCAVRGNSRSQPPGAVEGESAGQPANSPSALPEDALSGNPRTHERLGDSEASQKRKCGATRRFIDCARRRSRRSRRIGDSRQLEAPSPAQRKDAGRGETRGRIGKLNGTMHDLSNLSSSRSRRQRVRNLWRLCFLADRRPHHIQHPHTQQ